MLLAVPMLVCAQCHAAIVMRFAASPMARTSGLVKAAAEPEGEFTHPQSGTRFTIVKSGDKLELDWKGHRRSLDFFVGSRRMGRSYGIIEEGYFYEAPVGYYANRRLWDMAPGYERDRTPDFSRPVTSGCLNCHASGAEPLPGTINRYADTACLRGVSCERCHGDATAHVAHPGSGNIVNPRKLAPTARDSICEQCHLAGEARFARPGRQPADFKPGERLETYVAVFVAGAETTGGLRVNSHAEALAASRCRRTSKGALWCGTCHDPHGEAADYRAKCLGCHAASACPATRNRTDPKSADCIGCHMPKARAYDGGHTVFTDHSIPRRPPRYPARREKPESLQPYYSLNAATQEGQRDGGIAWALVAESYADPEAFDKAWPLLRAAAGSQPRDPLLYAKIGEALEAAGKAPEAARLYRLSLSQDSTQVEVLLRLAALSERGGDKDAAAALRRRAAAILPRPSP